MIEQPTLPKHLVFDWGNTLMADLPGQSGPMHTWPEVKAMPAVADVIPRLAAHHTLSIATNADASGAEEVRQALARVGLAEHFGAIFARKDLGLDKKESGFWAAVCQRLEAQPAEVCVIGDSLDSDILPAQRAGLQAIWYLATAPAESVTMPHFLSIRTHRELISQFGG